MFSGWALQRSSCPQPGWHLSQGGNSCRSTVWHSPAVLDTSTDHQGYQAGTKPAQRFWGAAASPLSHYYVSADCLHVTQRRTINNCMSYSFPLITRSELYISFIPSRANLPVHWQAEMWPWHTQIPCDNCTRALPGHCWDMVGTYWSVVFHMPQSFLRGVWWCGMTTGVAINRLQSL